MMHVITAPHCQWRSIIGHGGDCGYMPDAAGAVLLMKGAQRLLMLGCMALVIRPVRAA